MADKDEKKDDEAAKGGGGKKIILIVVPLLLVVVLAAVYFLVLAPGGSEETDATATEEATPTPTSTYVAGAVVKLDPITINLADSADGTPHFLKLGIALQATADAGEEVAGAKALDAAITLFSQKTLAEVSTREGRAKAKEKLVERLKELYEDKVYDLYYTEFVAQ